MKYIVLTIPFFFFSFFFLFLWKKQIKQNIVFFFCLLLLYAYCLAAIRLKKHKVHKVMQQKRVFAIHGICG